MSHRWIELLGPLVGRRVHWQGRHWLVLDLLPEGPSLVLESEQGHSIQGNQFGEALRRVRHTHTLPCLDEDGGLREDVRAWLEGRDLEN